MTTPTTPDTLTFSVTLSAQTIAALSPAAAAVHRTAVEAGIIAGTISCPPHLLLALQRRADAPKRTKKAAGKGS